MSPRICTSCPLPHVTTDWYQIEPSHPRQHAIECVPAHEARITREVRDFGVSHPPKPTLKPFQKRPSLAELLSLC